MRQSASWADQARVLMAAPLRGRTFRTQPVAVRIGRRMQFRRVTAL